MARSVQAMAEEIYFHAINHLAKQNGARALCLAGGCAFNSVANGKVFEKTPYRDMHIHPAAGDAGTAVGAAFYVWNQVLGMPRDFALEHAYWGPEYPDSRIKAALDAQGLAYEWVEEEGELCRRTAERIAAGDVVGWFQGRSEWGPRALGNRSIVVDPRRPDMKDILNARIKRREWFRPFAPSILEERTGEYFEESYPVPYMLQVYKIRPEKRAELPAVTHEDGTGRLQTVSERNNPLYHRLIKTFGEQTGTPVVLNTSFNENEPIVNTPEEAVDCFVRTKMDVLVLGKAVVGKERRTTDDG
jgi:carbamoyltransferase